MKNIILGVIIGFLLVGTVAFVSVQQNGILIQGGFGGEPKFAANQPDQTAPWIQFNNFQLPATGILPTQYGGTGGTNFTFAGTVLNFVGSTNGVLQLGVQNTSATGTASGDIVVTADNGTMSSFYGDFGINSSTYTNALIPPNGTNTVFLLAVGNSSNAANVSNTANLFIGAAQTNSVINFSAGNGLTATNVQITSNSLIVVQGSFAAATEAVPTNTAPFNVTGANAFLTLDARPVLDAARGHHLVHAWGLATNTTAVSMNLWLSNETTHAVSIFGGVNQAVGTNYFSLFIAGSGGDKVTLTNQFTLGANAGIRLDGSEDVAW